MVTRNRAQVAAFVRASLKGWNYAMQHSGEMIDLQFVYGARSW
jgi:hypothetical protein